MTLGAFVSLLNWGALFVSMRGSRFISPVPLIGPLTLGSGMALLPQTRPYAWLALVVDWGTFSFIVFGLPYMAFQFWSTSRINLVHSFASLSSGRAVGINLYRRHIAVISARFDPPLLRDDNGAHVVSFGLQGKWTATKAGFLIDGYSSNRQLVLSSEYGHYATNELNYPSDTKYNYDCLDRMALQKTM
jgi:hypothetical protein